MGTDKRARQKANRQSRRAEVEAEVVKETREASTKRVARIAAVIAAIVALILLITVLGRGDDNDGVAQFAPTSVPEGAPTPTPEPVLASSVPDDFDPFAGNRALALVEPAARNNAYDQAPPMTIDPAKSYIAVLDTDVGEISVELFPEASPVTVNNFVSLARDGYYDGTVFHRVLENFMAQGGDPTASGSGGPGYSFIDEVDNGLAFDATGLIAMANPGSPDSNGSQFFITFSVEETAGLTGDHTIFGQVVRNEAVLANITRVDPRFPDEAEGDLTVIESVRIIES